MKTITINHVESSLPRWAVEFAFAMMLLSAALLPVVYIPLGVLLLLYYNGALAHVGPWMIGHSIVASIMPVVWVLMGWENSYWIVDTLFFLTLIGYAYSLRRVLRAKN